MSKHDHLFAESVPKCPRCHVSLRRHVAIHNIDTGNFTHIGTLQYTLTEDEEDGFLLECDNCRWTLFKSFEDARKEIT